jgi:glycosyltransferase involved in cell wall biosynthesis
VKIAIMAPEHSHVFVEDFAKVLRERHETSTVLYGEIPIDHLLKHVQRQGADLIVCEWANAATAYVSRFTRLKLVVRVHRYEVFEPAMQTIQWDNVDLVLFDSSHIRELAIAAAPSIAQAEFLIMPPLVDLTLWPEKRYMGTRGRIGVVGNVIPRKNPSAWLDALWRLPKYFTLHVAGEWPDAWISSWWKYAVAPFGDRVKVYGALKQEELARWWQDKTFCLAAGLHEGCPVGVREAAACGVIPSVYEYPGAREHWDERHLWRTTDQAVEQMLLQPNDPNEGPAIAAKLSVQARGHELLAAIEKAVADARG